MIKTRALGIIMAELAAAERTVKALRLEYLRNMEAGEAAAEKTRRDEAAWWERHRAAVRERHRAAVSAKGDTP